MRCKHRGLIASHNLSGSVYVPRFLLLRTMTIIATTTTRQKIATSITGTSVSSYAAGCRACKSEYTCTHTGRAVN
jgi:hypothetical protein